MAFALVNFQIHELIFGRVFKDIPTKPAAKLYGNPTNPDINHSANSTTHLDLTRNHEVMDVVEGLLNALSDRHEPMVPENKDLKGQEAHGAGQGD